MNNKIALTKEMKIKLLTAIKNGYIEVSDLPDGLLNQPLEARILTKEEAHEYIRNLENEI